MQAPSVLVVEGQTSHAKEMAIKCSRKGITKTVGVVNASDRPKNGTYPQKLLIDM
jgi:hypothetical protein